MSAPREHQPPPYRESFDRTAGIMRRERWNATLKKYESAAARWKREQSEIAAQDKKRKRNEENEDPQQQKLPW
jgi:hypothetical protein